jgi:hypothetical protein
MSHVLAQHTGKRATVVWASGVEINDSFNWCLGVFSVRGNRSIVGCRLLFLLHDISLLSLYCLGVEAFTAEPARDRFIVTLLF